jgi:hypothetical protein
LNSIHIFVYTPKIAVGQLHIGENDARRLTGKKRQRLHPRGIAEWMHPSGAQNFLEFISLSGFRSDHQHLRWPNYDLSFAHATVRFQARDPQSHAAA